MTTNYAMPLKKFMGKRTAAVELIQNVLSSHNSYADGKWCLYYTVDEKKGSIEFFQNEKDAEKLVKLSCDCKEQIYTKVQEMFGTQLYSEEDCAKKYSGWNNWDEEDRLKIIQDVNVAFYQAVFMLFTRDPLCEKDFITLAENFYEIIFNESTTFQILRAKTGLTRKAFKETFGIPESTLQDWEEGRRSPTNYTLHLLINAVDQYISEPRNTIIPSKKNPRKRHYRKRTPRKNLSSIQKIRENTGLDRKSFSEKFGIPEQILKIWEEGVKIPKDYVINLIQRAVDKYLTEGIYELYRTEYSDIHTLRMKTELTYQEFSERFGIPKTTLAQWERKKIPTPDYILNFLMHEVEDYLSDLVNKTKEEPLRMLRRKTGLSRKEFIKMFGINEATLKNWEKGRRKPTDYAINLLTKTVDIYISKGTYEINLIGNENIRDLREKTGLSRQEFGKIFGIPDERLQSWESGRRKPADYVLKMLIYVVDEYMGNHAM